MFKHKRNTIISNSPLLPEYQYKRHSVNPDFNIRLLKQASDVIRLVKQLKPEDYFQKGIMRVSTKFSDSTQNYSSVAKQNFYSHKSSIDNVLKIRSFSPDFTTKYEESHIQAIKLKTIIAKLRNRSMAFTQLLTNMEKVVSSQLSQSEMKISLKNIKKQCTNHTRVNPNVTILCPESESKYNKKVKSTTQIPYKKNCIKKLNSLKGILKVIFKNGIKRDRKSVV